MVLRLNGRYVKTFEFLFEKNGKCIKLNKNEQKGAEKHYTQKKVPIILGIGCNVLEIVRLWEDVKTASAF